MLGENIQAVREWSERPARIGLATGIVVWVLLVWGLLMLLSPLGDGLARFHPPETDAVRPAVTTTSDDPREVAQPQLCGTSRKC
jgi:hypothetical protein